MKKALAFALALSVSVPPAYAVSWTPKQRWIMRILGVSFIAVSFVARNNESVNNEKADNVMQEFSSSHTNKQAPNYLSEQFNAVARESEFRRSANAWSIGKNASWGLAGVLLTISFIPNAWTRPVGRGNGILIGYNLKIGSKRRA